MSLFLERIRPHAPSPQEARSLRWIYVPYDQLDITRSLVAQADPAQTVLAFVESAAKARRRPYHARKLALLLSNGRHFALECAGRGFRIAWHGGEGSFAEGLQSLRRRYGCDTLEVMQPAERELRQELRDIDAEAPALQWRPNRLWLTEEAEFEALFPAAGPFRMDAFYRQVRRRSGVLMVEGKPVGGRFSFDGENRKPWRGDPPPPPRLSFAPDEVTQEVLQLVRERFGHAFGSLEGFDLPCSAADAEAVWAHALRHALPQFGPWEDAMAEDQPLLFHTAVSPLVNLGRLTPHRLLADVVAAHEAGRIPLASAEGFIRQLLGWREFVRHVHRVTDGFRTVSPEGAPNALGDEVPLPPTWWGGAPSGLRCLDVVTEQVRAQGWSHHITRLMVLGNIATLLGVRPRELTDWFWVGYIDAYDWVVEPNVLGMATWADGGLMTTKPYVSGAAYLHRMGDSCGRCQFDPTGKDAARPCPLTPLYWDFLRRHEPRLADNERLKLPMASMRKRSEAQKQHGETVRRRVLEILQDGRTLPADVASS